MAVTSLGDLQGQINAKSKSSATLNADSTLKVKSQTPAGVALTHDRVTFNGHNNSVTIGDGAGVRTGSVDQFLASLP